MDFISAFGSMQSVDDQLAGRRELRAVADEIDPVPTSAVEVADKLPAIGWVE